MDLIVAACRTLANRTRLRLLRAVFERPETTVQALAERVKLPMHAASKHLKLLRNFQFVQLTASGRYVRCSPPRAGSTSNAFLKELQELLKGLWGKGDLNDTLAQVCHSAPAPRQGWEDVYDALVAHFTAFTHLRRLLMLRVLVQKGTCNIADLAAQVRMSQRAARRHLDKLRRRGLAAMVAGSPGAWTILRAVEPPVRRKLQGIVLRALGAG
ncbi:MAG: ArsR family transcriptional regulator [Verrucomicrobia bacterium]|nr:ArsR family transcriptional regulator [Verrucomicrobiota bacterium]